jgi:ELWxxDGT repeat protein
VKDIQPGAASSEPENLIAVDGMVLFAATDGVSGIELWRSDGTEAGTLLLKDINPGAADSFPAGFFNWNGTVYFSADDRLAGRELWKTDGTAAGTVRVHGS